MPFAGKLVNIIQASVLAVISVATVIVIGGVTVYGTSRAADWAFGLPKHTSINWLGRHSNSIANVTHAGTHAAIAVGITNHSVK